MSQEINRFPEVPLHKDQLSKKNTQADRLAISIHSAFGSLAFLCLFLLLIATWIIWNQGHWSYLPVFDGFPFPILELGVSIFAIVLTIAVLISQNRQRKLEKLREELEFEVNLKAEQEITKVLKMLQGIQEKLGIETNDAELEQMKEDTDIDALHKKIEQS